MRVPRINLIPEKLIHINELQCLKNLKGGFKAAASPEGYVFKHPVFKFPRPLAAGGNKSEPFS